jgi:hypothetical protein
MPNRREDRGGRGRPALGVAGRLARLRGRRGVGRARLPMLLLEQGSSHG